MPAMLAPLLGSDTSLSFAPITTYVKNAKRIMTQKTLSSRSRRPYKKWILDCLSSVEQLVVAVDADASVEEAEAAVAVVLEEDAGHACPEDQWPTWPRCSEIILW